LYDIEGCYLLLSAIVRIWWRDALREQDSLEDVASFLGCTPDDLADGPPKYYTKRRQHDHYLDSEDLPDWPIRPRHGPAYTRRGIGE
jgi:hypothetical protein